MSTRPDDTFVAVRDADPDVLDASELEQLIRRIAELRAWCDARQVRATRRQRQLAEAGSGADPRSALARHGRSSGRDARAASEREIVCSSMPGFEDALATGTVTSGHVDAVATATRGLDEAATAEFVACADDLLHDASRSGVDAFARGCRELANAIRARSNSRADADELEQQRAQSKISRWVDQQTGMHKTLIEADPLTDRQIWAAVQRERARLRRRDRRAGSGTSASWDRLTVDALVSAVTAAESAAGGGARATLVVHVDAGTLGEGSSGLCELDNGDRLPIDTMRRLACEADVIPVVLGSDGVVLDQGRTRRLATPEQRRAIEAMQTTCSHPDCRVTVDDCRLHHVVPWQHGGATDLHNLAPLCERHHHLVHEGGWTFTMTADRHATWVRPDGVTDWVGSLLDRAPRPNARGGLDHLVAAGS